MMNSEPLLTPREKEVLMYLVKGKNNPEIAEEMHITTHTAKSHVSSIIQKLNAKCRVDAAVIALREGIVE